MKTKIFYALILLAISVFWTGDAPMASASNKQKRIRFQVTTVGEGSAGERQILAQTTIEGLPGTDFNINLQTENFKMQARFLSDLVAEDKLKLRAKLNTRRFYGYSPANLPLYEEDAQNHTLEIGFDQTVVLLPFGRGGSAETLKIEITPAVFSISKTDEEAKKLRIDFDKQIPSGEIFIQASKTPHRFEAEVVLLADGEAIARGGADCLLEEATEIILHPVTGSNAANRSFRTKLAVNKFTRHRPQDLVDIGFDFYRADEQTDAAKRPIISKGAGVGSLGAELAYPLNDKNLPGGKNYELKFKIRLGPEEEEEN